MQRRIEPRSRELAEREKQAVYDLVDLFLDGVVRTGSVDKALGDRLDALYAQLGYETLDDMLGAWGFEVVVDKPASAPEPIEWPLDLTTILDELDRRYEDREKPSVVPELKAQNPDLPLTQLGRELRKQRRSLTDELKSRGFLGGAKRTRQAAAAHDEHQLQEALDSLSMKTMGLDNASKQSTLDAIFAAYPKESLIIAAAMKRKAVNKTELQMLGIMAPTKALLQREGIRSAPADKLAKDYLAAGGPAQIIEGLDAYPMPANVLGVDFEHCVELREVRIALTGSAAASLPDSGELGMELDCNEDGWGYPAVTLTDGRGHMAEHRLIDRGLFDDMLEGSESELAEHCGAVSEGLFGEADAAVLKVRMRFLGKLRGSTVAWFMRCDGLVTDIDLAGSMSWRARLRLAQRGKLQA